MEDILKAMVEAGFEPEIVEDSSDFSPITGKYVCRIDSAGRLQGVSKSTNKEYDFRSINIQVAEIIEGDKATNRFLKLTYNPDADGVKRLMNDLFTAGIKLEATSDAELDAALEGLKDKTMNIRCWVWTPVKDKSGNPIPEENRKAYQQIRVVKEFKGKKKADNIKSNVPF